MGDVYQRLKHGRRVRTHRRDSLGSWSSIGGTHCGDTFWPSFTASNSTRFLPDCGSRQLRVAYAEEGEGYFAVLEVHDVAPAAGDLADVRGVVPHAPGERVVRAGEEPLELG